MEQIKEKNYANDMNQPVDLIIVASSSNPSKGAKIRQNGFDQISPTGDSMLVPGTGLNTGGDWLQTEMRYQG